MNEERKDNIFDNLPIISKIEINCKSTSLTWDKSAYKEDFLAGIIEKEEFDAILEHASKILGDALEKKRENDEVKLPKSMMFLSTITVILSICYVVVLLIAAQSPANSTILLVIAIICLAGASALALTLSILNYCRKIKQFRTLETFIKDDLDYYFSHINAKFSGKCEFRFLPLKEQIIELVTFVKTAKMIEEDMNENRKLVINYDDERSNIDLSQDRDDESRSNFRVKESATRREMEMGILSSSRISSNQATKPQPIPNKKKFGKVKRK